MEQEIIEIDGQEMTGSEAHKLETKKYRTQND